jgi:hypothetical protein
VGSEEGEKIGPTAVGGALRFRLEAKETEAITQEIKKMREEGGRKIKMGWLDD